MIIDFYEFKTSLSSRKFFFFYGIMLSRSHILFISFAPNVEASNIENKFENEENVYVSFVSTITFSGCTGNILTFQEVWYEPKFVYTNWINKLIFRSNCDSCRFELYCVWESLKRNHQNWCQDLAASKFDYCEDKKFRPGTMSS